MSIALLRAAGLTAALAGLAILGLPARAEDRPPDLALYLDLAKYAVTSVSPMKDAKTGFVVGGKNDTALVRSLTEINGRSIADLEKDMRPDATSEVGSTSGFLGKDEKLLDVLAADNAYVVDELGLTHQELAKHLHGMGTIANWLAAQRMGTDAFVYHGRRFKITLAVSRGFQPSPFLDGTKSGSNVAVENLDNGKKLGYALLVPFMIDRYGFYEGQGTPYRVDPRNIVELFDFLQNKPKNR